MFTFFAQQKVNLTWSDPSGSNPWPERSGIFLGLGYSGLQLDPETQFVVSLPDLQGKLQKIAAFLEQQVFLDWLSVHQALDLKKEKDWSLRIGNSQWEIQISDSKTEFLLKIPSSLQTSSGHKESGPVILRGASIERLFAKESAISSLSFTTGASEEIIQQLKSQLSSEFASAISEVTVPGEFLAANLEGSTVDLSI